MAKEIEKSSKTISRSLTHLFKGKRTSALFDKFRRDKSKADKDLTLAVGNQTYQPESDPGIGTEDEYEGKKGGGETVP